MKPHVKCIKICVNLNEDLHVKACVKPHVKWMWKYVWKGWRRFTPFSHIFHYAKFHMHVKYVCEMHVKNVWKMCEKSVKIGHFSHVFHMVFHIHTPSSATKGARGGLGGSEKNWGTVITSLHHHCNNITASLQNTLHLSYQWWRRPLKMATTVTKTK